MAFVLETGAGLVDANSYSSVAAADQYHLERLHNAEWAAAETETKEAALIWATRILDEHVVWTGARKSTTQALLWPRIAVWNREGDTTFPSDSIPAFLQRATAALAWHLIKKDRTAESGTTGMSSLKVAEIAISWLAAGARNEEVLPREVLDMIDFAADELPSNSPGFRNVDIARV